MSKTAFIFPGQGSQYISMGKDFYENFSEAKDVFNEVDEALSQNLSQLIFEGDEETLALTTNTQPALMAVSVAIIETLKKQGNFDIVEEVSSLAGHSLGEYSALYTSGVFSLTDVAKLLRVRGNSMQNACKAGVGAMAAVIGINDISIIEELVKEASKNGVIEIANDNAPGQVVLSGQAHAIEKAEELAKAKGAKKYVKLNVSAPFHSSLIEEAKKPMADALASASINPFQIPVIANVKASAYENAYENSEEVKKLLLEQITGRVRWVESVSYMMKNQGTTNFVEIGAGKVLSGLVKRIAKQEKQQVNISNIETIQDLEKFLG